MQNIKDQLNTIVKLFNNGEKEIALNIINLLLPSNEKNIELLFLHAKICINLNEISKANKNLKILHYCFYFKTLLIYVYHSLFV